MDLTFDIRLMGPVREAAILHLENIRYRDGQACFTKKGKEKQRLKYEPLVVESRKELIKLLKLNYPEFIGRFENVWQKRYGQGQGELFLSVSRNEVENETT